MTKAKYMALDDLQSVWTDKIKPFIQADTLWKKAQELSTAEKAQVKTNLGLPQEIYSKTEVNGLVDTPHQNYETVDAFANLPATGSKDTIYRVANYDGSLSQVDDTKYSEYAWDGTQYVFLCVKSQIGEVFDISAYNNNTKYADLAAALGSNGANVPSTLRHGGMTVKFVQSSDSKYVQYRYMSSYIADADFTNVDNWQSWIIDKIPTASSKNLASSNGIYRTVASSGSNLAESDLDVSDEDGNVLLRLKNGGIKTKKFNSEEISKVLNDLSDGDLDIADEAGNVLIRSKKGHIKTKNFDSEDYVIGIDTDYLLIPVYGQSLAIGGDTTRLTTSFIYPYKSGNQPNLTTSFSEDKEISSNGLVDSLVENYTDNKVCASRIKIPKIVSFASGQGSTSIMGLKKGTANYQTLLTKIQTAYDTATSEGKELIVPAFCWVQGEDDRVNGYTNNYKAELIQLRQDLDADIKRITGQSEDVHCIVYQTNQLAVLSTDSTFNPNSYDSVQAARMVVPNAQYELIRDNKYFHPSSPVYPMNFYVSSNGAMIHITSESQRLLGYYEGIAACRLLTKENANGLYVKNVVKIDSTHVKLELRVPCPPVVIDTESVNAVENYGFSIITQNNENILTDVSIVTNHKYLCEILLTTSQDCSDSKVRYACNGQVGKSGREYGARGNIRDSQGELYKAIIGQEQKQLDNWLYAFDIIINN